MIRVTAGDRTFSSILLGVAILIVLVNIAFNSNPKTLIALAALLGILGLFFLYNINFIDLWISGDKIILTKRRKNIHYASIEKLTVLPVSVRLPAGHRTICAIKFENESGRTFVKFLDVDADRSHLVDDLRKMIRDAAARRMASKRS
ncbi:MAG TPA: hypothetical protein VNR87_08155 [Flavisolibacter sp.]|nr:hypothetical protein [Flavisolibacter sp.]